MDEWIQQAIENDKFDYPVTEIPQIIKKIEPFLDIFHNYLVCRYFNPSRKFFWRAFELNKKSIELRLHGFFISKTIKNLYNIDFLQN